MSKFEDIFSNENDKLERLESISYEHFFKDYLVQNRLCIFSAELTRNWRSRMEWVKNGRPDFEFLQKTFGEAIVPVANCSNRYFSSQLKEDMKMSDFIDYLKNHQRTDEKCLYLKDWHFCKVFPEYDAYDVPIYFKSDWLNEYWDQCSDVHDDYRFVYFGPKGSWTPFHADVFRSYSWSANICGCKKWIIYPPGQEDYLCDNLGNLTYDVTSDETEDQNKYPKIKQCAKPIIVIQKEGEVIFVPSGWHHQVHNLEDTISINHNWTNACGLIKMWKHLQNELIKIQKSIDDCRDMDDWHSHCQLMLSAMTGMDYKGFVEFLTVIAKPRLEFVKNPDDFPSQQRQSVFMEWLNAIKDIRYSWDQYDIIKYCAYDITLMHNCANMVKSDETFKELNDQYSILKLDGLITQLKCITDGTCKPLLSQTNQAK